MLSAVVFWQWRVIYQIDEWNQIQMRTSFGWDQSPEIIEVERYLVSKGFKIVDLDHGRKMAAKNYMFMAYPMGGEGRVLYSEQDGKAVNVRTNVRLNGIEF